MRCSWCLELGPLLRESLTCALLQSDRTMMLEQDLLKLYIPCFIFITTQERFSALQLFKILIMSPLNVIKSETLSPFTPPFRLLRLTTRPRRAYGSRRHHSASAKRWQLTRHNYYVHISWLHALAFEFDLQQTHILVLWRNTEDLLLPTI